MSAEIATVWLFESSTSAGKTYQTLLYVDGSTSCDCPGWTRRCVNGLRSCKHVRYVEMGVADSHSVGRKDYRDTQSSSPAAKAPQTQATGRKFNFD